jgi:hypothetical protein
MSTTPKPKPKQRRTTSWERKCDGSAARSSAMCKLRPVSVKDIESISRAIRAASLTRIDDYGVVRGEAADSVREDRQWSEL